MLLLQAKVLLASTAATAEVRGGGDAAKRVRSALACFEATEDIAKQSQCFYLLARLHARAGAIGERNTAAAAWLDLQTRAAHIARTCSVVVNRSE